LYYYLYDLNLELTRSSARRP